MNQEWENPFSIGTNENNETVTDYRDWETREHSTISKKPNNTSNQNHGTYWRYYQ